MKKIMDSKVPFTVGDMWSFSRGYWLHCSSLPKKKRVSFHCAKLPTVLCMIFQEQLSELRCKPFSLLSLNSQTPALFPSPFQFWWSFLLPCPESSPLCYSCSSKPKPSTKNQRKPCLRENQNRLKKWGKTWASSAASSGSSGASGSCGSTVSATATWHRSPPVVSRGNPHGFV